MAGAQKKSWGQREQGGVEAAGYRGDRPVLCLCGTETVRQQQPVSPAQRLPRLLSVVCVRQGLNSQGVSRCAAPMGAGPAQLSEGFCPLQQLGRKTISFSLILMILGSH